MTIMNKTSGNNLGVVLCFSGRQTCLRELFCLPQSGAMDWIRCFGRNVDSIVGHSYR